MRVRWPGRSFFRPVLMPVIEASQCKFGYPTLHESIRLAKIVYAIGGWVWSVSHFDWALEFAMHAEDLDPVHFPHWAAVPDEGTVRCPVCGGWTQPPADGWHAVPNAGR